MAWEEAALELVRAMRFVSPHTVGLANELLNPKTYPCEKLVETANNLLVSHYRFSFRMKLQLTCKRG